MNYLIYMSSAFKLMSDEELLNILTVSRKNNSTKNLTGMLLYGDGTFVQVLEGNKDDLKSTYDVIKQDSRHRNLTLLGSGDLRQRNFPQWSMGFNAMDQEMVKKFEGYLDLRKEGHLTEAVPHPAITVLKTFADANNLM